jgi:hypothetical protein
MGKRAISGWKLSHGESNIARVEGADRWLRSRIKKDLFKALPGTCWIENWRIL